MTDFDLLEDFLAFLYATEGDRKKTAGRSATAAARRWKLTPRAARSTARSAMRRSEGERRRGGGGPYSIFRNSQSVLSRLLNPHFS